MLVEKQVNRKPSANNTFILNKIFYFIVALCVVGSTRNSARTNHHAVSVVSDLRSRGKIEQANVLTVLLTGL